MSEKIFKATIDSKSTQHPEGKKTVVVIVSDKMKKDAIIKAQKELAFWDVQNHELYKNPKMEELSGEEGQQAMTEYLASKEEEGQMGCGDIVDQGEEFDATESLSKIQTAVVKHKDYQNCADPYDPSDFIKNVKDNFAAAYAKHGSKICAAVVVGFIEDMTKIAALYKPEFVETEVIRVALEANANTQKLIESAANIECKGDFVQAGPGAPDYSKQKDNFIEISKHKISEDTIARVGVGHKGGKFLASYDFCLAEKESGALSTTHGDINSFADKTFSARDNAIHFGFGMVIDHLNKMKDSLNKQLMHNDAKKIESAAAKFFGGNCVEMFDKNLSSTTLPIIDQFCDMPEIDGDDQDGSEQFTNSMNQDRELASTILCESGIKLHLQSVGEQLIDALMTNTSYGNTLTPDVIAKVFVAGCRQTTDEDLEREINAHNVEESAFRFYKKFLNLYVAGNLNFNINTPTYDTKDVMHRYINKMLTAHGLDAPLEQYVAMADNFNNAFKKHEIQLNDGAFYTAAASEIMNTCRAKGETTLIEDFLDADDVDLLVKEAATMYPQESIRCAERTKNSNYVTGMLENIMKVDFNITASLSFSISCTWWGGDKFVSTYEVTKDGKEITSDKCQMPTKLEALTFSLNRVKICVQDCDDSEHRLKPIDNALTDPVTWFDAYAESVNEKTRHHNPKGSKETKPVTAPETKPEPKPETKPVTEPESKPFKPAETKQVSDDDLSMVLGITPSQEKVSEAEPEKSALEKQIEKTNTEIAKIKPGQTVSFDDLPNLVYHGTKGNSSTKIKDACVSLMYYNGVYNTGDIEKTRGTHFDVGNLAHTLTLEPELVESEYKKKPDVKEPTQPQREKYDAWTKAGKPENQSLKPSDKVIDAVEAWVAIGKPENQSLKPADAVIAKVQAHAADSENNPAPTANQLNSFDAWVLAGKPEPYKGRPTEKQIDQYCAWESAGKPEPYNGKPNDVCIERCEFWDNFTAENKDIVIVDEDNWKVAEAMAKAIHEDEFAGKILNHPQRVSEKSYFKVDEETELLVKVRPDIEVGAVLADLKTIQLRGNPDEEWLLSELRREIKRRKYHVSASMYLDVTGKKQFVWIFVNKEPGYHWVAVVKASQETLSDGYEIYRDKLNAIKRGYETGVWPKPASIQKMIDDNGAIELPEA